MRFPGLISHETEPGGGTTDYAVEIFYEAIKHKAYTCYLRNDCCLDMMYMPDAMNFTPAQLAKVIQQHIPDFEITYDVDPVRQAIADSWPNSMDDSCAREEWGWKPEYDIQAMTKDMLEKLTDRLAKEGVATQVRGR